MGKWPTAWRLRTPRGRAGGGMRGDDMTDWSTCPGVESVPGRVSGNWVFTGTRLPVYALFENLCRGRDDPRLR